METIDLKTSVRKLGIVCKRWLASWLVGDPGMPAGRLFLAGAMLLLASLFVGVTRAAELVFLDSQLSSIKVQPKGSTGPQEKSGHKVIVKSWKVNDPNFVVAAFNPKNANQFCLFAKKEIRLEEISPEKTVAIGNLGKNLNRTIWPIISMGKLARIVWNNEGTVFAMEYEEQGKNGEKDKGIVVYSRENAKIEELSLFDLKLIGDKSQKGVSADFDCVWLDQKRCLVVTSDGDYGLIEPLGEDFFWFGSDNKNYALVLEVSETVSVERVALISEPNFQGFLALVKYEGDNRNHLVRGVVSKKDDKTILTIAPHKISVLEISTGAPDPTHWSKQAYIIENIWCSGGIVFLLLNYNGEWHLVYCAIEGYNGSYLEAKQCSKFLNQKQINDIIKDGYVSLECCGQSQFYAEKSLLLSVVESEREGNASGNCLYKKGMQYYTAPIDPKNGNAVCRIWLSPNGGQALVQLQKDTNDIHLIDLDAFFTEAFSKKIAF